MFTKTPSRTSPKHWDSGGHLQQNYAAQRRTHALEQPTQPDPRAFLTRSSELEAQAVHVQSSATDANYAQPDTENDTLEDGNGVPVRIHEWIARLSRT